jgi:tagaturonate reductase
VPNGEAFGREVLDRFANPFLRHALVDITLQQTAKMRVRVVPSIVRAAERNGTTPPSLTFGFAAYLLFVRASMRSLKAGLDSESERVRAVWRTAPGDSDAELHRVARDVSADRQLWQADLAGVAGFVDLVATDLVRICRGGVASALDEHLANLAVFARATPSPIGNRP